MIEIIDVYKNFGDKEVLKGARSRRRSSERAIGKLLGTEFPLNEFKGIK